MAVVQTLIERVSVHAIKGLMAAAEEAGFIASDSTVGLGQINVKLTREYFG